MKILFYIGAGLLALGGFFIAINFAEAFAGGLIAAGAILLGLAIAFGKDK